ncbi:hypothetical protein D3C85_930130 [compost metagenome]
MQLIGRGLVGIEQAAEQALAIVPAADGDLIAVTAREDGIGALAALILLGANRPAMGVDVEILLPHAAKVIECQRLSLHLDGPARMGQLDGAGKATGGRGDAALERIVLDVDEAGHGGHRQDGQHYDDQHQFYQGKAVGSAF